MSRSACSRRFAGACPPNRLRNLLAENGVWREHIAEARIGIEMSRLLAYKAAWPMDTARTAARSEISRIKVIVSRLAQKLWGVVQQDFGAAGM
jgi:acyl-CoA dehydrogenase